MMKQNNDIFDGLGSIRTEKAPKKTIIVYKLMRLENGKLYPLFIDSSEPVKLGVWYDADSPDFATLKKLEAGYYYLMNDDKVVEKTSKKPSKKDVISVTPKGLRYIFIEATDKKQRRFGENRRYWNIGLDGSGSVSMFSMRPGWHAGSLPTMRQIGKGSNKNLRDDSFVWTECEISADIDYNPIAQKNPDKDMPDTMPKNGYYLKATNADKVKSQADKVGWYVAGAIKINRIISDKEARSIIDKFNKRTGLNVLYDYQRESGKDFDPKRGLVGIGETEIIDFTHYNYYKALQEFNSLKDSKSPFAIKERAELAAYLKECEKNFPKDYNKHLRSLYLIETDGEYILKFGDIFSMPKNFERIDLSNLKRTIDTEKANAEDYKYDAQSVAKVVVYKYLYKMAKKVYRTRKDQPIMSVDKFVKKFQMQDTTLQKLEMQLINDNTMNTIQSLDTVLGALVYHNSPYLLKKADGSFIDPKTGEKLGFDHRFMSKGEGSQVHGWGSYFSVKDLRRYGHPKSMYYYDGELLQNIISEAAYDILMLNDFELNSAIGEVMYRIERLKPLASNHYDKILSELKSLKQSKIIEKRESHNYVVEIPDNDGINYIEESKPIKPKQLSQIVSKLSNTKQKDYFKTLKGCLGANIYYELNLTLGSPEKASKFLKKCGFFGIHYVGQVDGEGYVIFDENDAKIVKHELFGLPEPTKNINEVLSGLDALVYHNSPYLLKKADGSFIDPITKEKLGFDHRFMSKGEGNQIHGWGSYFSVKDLRNYGQPSSVSLAESTLNNSPTADVLRNGLWHIEWKYLLSPAFTNTYALRYYIETYTADKDKRRFDKERKKILDYIDRGIIVFKPNNSHNYVVEIPDNDGFNYLEENEPIKPKQLSKIVAMLNKKDKKTGDYFKTLKGSLCANIYYELSLTYNSREKASKLLKKCGIVGIHYFGERDGECYVIFDENDAKIVKHELFGLGSIVSEPTKQTFYENLYNQLESIVKDDSFEKNGIRKFILSHIPEDYKNDDIDGIVEVFYQRLRSLKCGEKGLGSVSHKFNIGDTIKMPSSVTAKIIGFVDGDKYKIEFDDTVSGRKKIAVYFWKLEEKAVLSDDYHVGDLITYKGYEETIFKIVAVKGNRYIVIDLADRTKTKNEIPMSDNDKLQMASFPLLVKEMELLDNFNNLIKDLETELINSKLVYVVKYNKNEEIKPAIAKKIEELMLANINLEKYKLLYKRYAIDNKYRESIVNKVYEDIYDKLLQLANENTKPKPKFKIGDYVIYYLSPKNPLKIRSVRYDGRSYYYGFDKNISNFQNIYEKYLSKSLGNVVEELQPSGLSGFEDEFSKELLVAEMHLLELEKLKDFGEKIGGSAKDRYNGRKSKDSTENGQKTKGFNRLPTMDEMQSFGQECFHTKFKPNVSDFEDFGLNKIVARLCFFHYYGIFDKYAGYNVNSINDLYSLVDDKRIQNTITSYFIENKRHTQNFKTQYFAPDSKVHFYAIDFVYTALSMNLEKDLKDDFDYKNVLKAYNRGNKDWHFYRDKCIFLDKNKNDITEENKQRVFNLAYENAMNDFPLFRVMLTYNNGIIFIAHKDCKENQRTWRPLSQKYAKDLQQDICSACWQDIYKHYAELYVKGKELYGQQFGFDEPDKWRFKDKEGLFAKVREGKDWRNGRNAEPKDFIDTFGFRAVEFGETMPQKERWEHLNRTFDSFMDLCDILNIKPENISLGGTLALSFGSRGRGGKHAAAAHYEPTKKVINLTRRSGAGCLAHEWFHAFDNQVCDHSYAYGQSCYGTRDAYSGWITNQDVSHYFYLFSNYCSNINGFNFYKSAVALDYYEKRKEDYWQKKLECGARAFEWYVIKKLTDKHQINEYLAQIPLAEPDRMKLYPYPHPNDYDTIEKIFDGIFKNVQQVKTPIGITIR